MIAKPNSAPAGAATTPRRQSGPKGAAWPGPPEKPVLETARQFMADHPIGVFVAAFAAGVLLGWLTKRR